MEYENIPPIRPTITSNIIADSVNPDGQRITTFILDYPRFIHSELMTHRVFTRNAGSSRAIPTKKQIERIMAMPACPVTWGLNQRGMQAAETADAETTRQAMETWYTSSILAVSQSKILAHLGLHKQIVNRVLEPYINIKVLVTATDWLNFFKLRAHPQAQPEFQVLAYRMLGDYLRGNPQEIDWGGWHLPFGDRMPGDVSIQDRIRIAVARAARVSYETFDGEINVEKDFALHDDLMTDAHWSPFEHPAKASRGRHANFHGWASYRTMVDMPERQTGSLQEIYDSMPDWVSDFISGDQLNIIQSQRTEKHEQSNL